MAQQKIIDELHAKTEGKYGREEIANYLDMAAKFTSKSVLTVLIETIVDGGNRGLSNGKCNELISKVRKVMPYESCSFINIDVNGTTNRINVSTTICQKTTQLPVFEFQPGMEGAAHELFEQYDFLKENARGYWVQFCRQYPELLGEIQKYRHDVDYSELKIDKAAPRTLYFDPECMTRVAVFALWVDKDGKPLRRIEKK